ncbi:helix-turn-helix domain-containing protein [Gimesia sp.]|uniref:helix-turn-helix domain-containing protein n=1 Tax=Gimesia sp. TaxID=2024833 RepID=UPI003A8CC3DD
MVSELQSIERPIDHKISEYISDNDDRLLLRSNEVAKRLSISERHLRRMTMEGGLPCIRIGQSVRYRVETVQDWLRKAESTEGPKQQVSLKKKNIKTKQPKIPQKSQQKKVKKQRVTKPKNSATVSKQKKVPAKKSSPKRSKLDPEQERPNPFRLLLKEIGVDRDTLGPVTFEELMKIAEVDIPIFHGWMYLGQGMPEEALEKLRKHFTKTV